MIEKIKKISNPLTIIAIFAGFAEIAGTTALFALSNELHLIFIWFVMLFPTVLILLFFLTLNFNSSVLYAPSDFENDNNFLEALKEKRSEKLNIQRIEREIKTLFQTIVSRINKDNTDFTDTQKEQIKETIRDEFDSLQAHVSLIKENAETLSFQALPKFGLNAQIFGLLVDSDHPVTASEISKKINVNRAKIYKVLHVLAETGAIKENNKTIKTGNGAVRQVKCYTINTL